jgi:hypothetical protein
VNRETLSAMFPDLRGRLFTAIQPPGSHDHFCPFFTKTEGNGFPYPATASGDHNHFAFKPFHQFLSIFFCRSCGIIYFFLKDI